MILENSVLIKATDNILNRPEKLIEEVYPLKYISMLRYIKKSLTPPQPLMVARLQTSLMMRMPFFKPVTEYKNWRNIVKMALFCKESINTDNVSLSDTGYPGTGVKVNVGDAIVVNNLAPNKSYRLACGGYTQDNVCVNGMGEQTDEIVPLLPLNWSILFGYLAIVSRSFCSSNRLDHHQIAKRAAESLLKEYIMKNEIKYPQLNVYTNSLFAYCLNYKLIMHASPCTIRQIIESFIILARISKMYKSEEKQVSESNQIFIVKQKSELKLINFLMLALELAIGIKNPVIIKRLVCEIYNYLRPYLTYENHPSLIKYCVLFCHQSIRCIPREQMDSSIRRVGACLAYELN